MKTIFIVCLAALSVPSSAFANCYVIQNNTRFSQRVDIHYNEPVNSGPTTIPLPAHGQYPDQGSWCWNETGGYTAYIYIEPGDYTLHFNGKPWGAPVVFGDGSNVTPSGTFTLDPPQHSTSKIEIPRYDPGLGELGQLSLPLNVPPPPTPNANGIHVQQHCFGNNAKLSMDEQINSQGDGYIKQRACIINNFDSEQDLAAWKTKSYNLTDRCNNGRVIQTISVDSNITGIARQWDCSTGELTLEKHVTNNIVDGSFQSTWASGQFDLGKPVGRWAFTGVGGTWTEEIPANSTVYWAVPDVFDANVNDSTSGCFHMYLQAGQLTDGVKEGVWYEQTCNGGKVLPVVVGGYLDGKPDGKWRWYSPYNYTYDGSLIGIETFDRGTVSGPFMYSSGHLMVTGEISDRTPYGENDLRQAVSIPPFRGKVKLSGIWRYYTNTGILLGESSITNGNGHLVQFADNGVIAAEGDVTNGLPNGVWKIRDQYGRLCMEQTYDDGVETGITNLPCPVPALKPPPSK